MKGIKDIIVKGSIFAVLSAVFCMGGIPAVPLVSTAHAEVIWSEDMTFNESTTMSDGVRLSKDTTLTVAEGKTLTINGSINCNNNTLTIAGPGTVTVIGESDLPGIFQGEKVTLESGTLNVTGRNNSGIAGAYVTITGGTLNVTIEDRGTGISTSENFTITGGTVISTGGIYGDGISVGGKFTITGGTVTATGGNGGNGISVGRNLTLEGGTLTSTWDEGVREPFGEVSAIIIANGIAYTDGTNIYSRDIDNSETMQALNGKTLTPCAAAIDRVYYITIQEAMDAAEGKTVKLLRDVQTTSPLTVSKNLILDLNGHTIDRGLSGKTGDGNSSGSVIKIGLNGNLTLSDNSIDQTGLITGGYAYEGGGVQVKNGGIFTMTGGTISGNKSSNFGGGVFVRSSDFTMTGGKICGNINTYGGGVYVKSSNFTMTGGEISDNSATTSGGGLYLEDIYNGKNCSMTGGRICNNTAGSAGGGVYAIACNFTMGNDAVITGNSSLADGGGLYAARNTEFTMIGGEISYNSAVACGGGIYNGWNFNMNGGKITLNTANVGGGIYSGDYNSNNTITMTGGEITYNKAEQNAGGIYMYSPSSYPFMLSGVPEITGNVEGGEIVNGALKGGTPSNVCVRDENIINISGALGNSTPIGVTLKNGSGTPTTGVFAEADDNYNSGALTANDIAHFKSDIESYIPKLNNDKAELVTAYKVTVTNGDGGGYFLEGASVSIKANAPASGKQFKEWKGTDGLTFTSGSATTAEATFTMPANAVTVEAFYEDIPKVKAPTFTPNGGTYTSAQNVTISSETSGADIYYTLDGSTPTASDTKYTGPVSVTGTTTIKAIAIKTDMLDSEVTSAIYTINSVTPVNTKYQVTVNNGTGDGEYEENATVTIKADAPAEGKVFDKWTGDGVTFAGVSSPETTFSMPAHNVTVTAVYKDKEQVKPDPDDSGKKDDPGKKDDSGKEDDPVKEEKPVIPIPAENIVIDIPEDSPVERDSVAGEDFVNDVGESLAEAAGTLGKKEEGEESADLYVEFNEDLSIEEINSYLNNPEKLTISVNSVSSDSLESDTSRENAAKDAGLKLTDPKAMTSSVVIKIDIYADNGVHIGTVKKLDRGIDLKIDVSGFTEEVISLAKSFLIMSRHTPADKWFIAGVGKFDPETKTVNNTVREFSEFAVAADSREVIGIEAEEGLKADKGASDSDIEKLVKDSVKAYRILTDGKIKYDVPGEVYSVGAKMEPGRTVSQASVAISLTVNEGYRDAYLEEPESQRSAVVELTSSESEKPAPKPADTNTVTVTVSDNKPMDIRTETLGDYQVTYAHEIPFFGKSKPTVENFGGTFTVSKGTESYKVTKIKVNKKKHLIQITGLEGADKDTVKAVKKATKGSSGLSFKVNPYYVKDSDNVTTKPKKDGSLKSVKVKINGKDYKAKKEEYEYDSASKLITFKGENLAGSCTAK